VKSKLRVIAGHGGADSGAVATIPARDEVIVPARDETASDGTVVHHDAVTIHHDEETHVERELNIAAVLSFNDAATREYVPHDVTVVTYPKSDRDGNEILLEKIAQANAVGADQLLIEVHHNIGAEGDGAQLWYSKHAKQTAGDETWLVMPFLQAELGFLLGETIPVIESSRSRFIDPVDGQGKLGILDDTTCTAILIEARNVNLVITKDWEYSFGAALARAMAKYLGWPSATVTAPAPAPAPAPVPADPGVQAKLDRAKQLVADLATKVAAL
jgi:N-acetylmuramoyl-L-alanine amidase